MEAKSHKWDRPEQVEVSERDRQAGEGSSATEVEGTLEAWPGWEGAGAEVGSGLLLSDRNAEVGRDEEPPRATWPALSSAGTWGFLWVREENRGLRAVSCCPLLSPRGGPSKAGTKPAFCQCN